ncbi:hypothetical protein HHE02_10830 [Helicobacter heilmannii]|nr:hypothetical protein HHE02_10830 [Helicobacter heilmannii]CRF50879.1 hypothetical protein HHE06_07320 [Helicobacter heilmannii]
MLLRYWVTINFTLTSLHNGLILQEECVFQVCLRKHFDPL